MAASAAAFGAMTLFAMSCDEPRVPVPTVIDRNDQDRIDSPIDLDEIDVDVDVDGAAGTGTTGADSDQRDAVRPSGSDRVQRSSPSSMENER